MDSSAHSTQARKQKQLDLQIWLYQKKIFLIYWKMISGFVTKIKLFKAIFSSMFHSNECNLPFTNNHFKYCPFTELLFNKT